MRVDGIRGMRVLGIVACRLELYLMGYGYTFCFFGLAWVVSVLDFLGCAFAAKISKKRNIP